MCRSVKRETHPLKLLVVRQDGSAQGRCKKEDIENIHENILGCQAGQHRAAIFNGTVRCRFSETGIERH